MICIVFIFDIFYVVCYRIPTYEKYPEVRSTSVDERGCGKMQPLFF